MTLRIRIVNGLKSKSVNFFLLFFYVTSLILTKVKNSAGIYFSYVLLVTLFIILYVQREQGRDIVNIFTRFENDLFINKIAGWLSLLGWCSFIFIPFSINIHLIYMAKALMIIFAISIAVSSILTIFILESNGYKSIKKIRLALFSLISLCYALSSAFSASLFCRLVIWIYLQVHGWNSYGSLLHSLL